MRSSEADAINAEIDRAMERVKAAERWRRLLPELLRCYTAHLAENSVSTARNVRPHWFAQKEERAWWLGDVVRRTRLGAVATTVLVTRSGTLYAEYKLNLHVISVKRCHRLTLKACDHDTLKAIIMMLLPGITA